MAGVGVGVGVGAGIVGVGLGAGVVGVGVGLDSSPPQLASNKADMMKRASTAHRA